MMWTNRSASFDPTDNCTLEASDGWSIYNSLICKERELRGYVLSVKILLCSELNKQNNNGPFKIVIFSNIVITNAPYKFNNNEPIMY